MSMVMLVVLIGVALGALMIPIVLSQSGNTVHTDTRVQALHQAESGVNAMLSRIRGATSGGIGLAGVKSQLPCNEPGNPLTWRQPSVSTTGYDVTLQYFNSDPLKVVVSAPPPGTPTAMSCSPGVGPAIAPSFARITSIGTDRSSGRTSTRTLYTTYAFKTTDSFSFNALNTSTIGGQIRLNPRRFFDIDSTECLATSVAAPDAGSELMVQACSTQTTPANLPAQLYFYYADLTLRLVSSVTASSPGLCVTVSTTTNAVTLEPCPSSASNPATNQQWSLDANAAFIATGTSSLPVCLSVRPTDTKIATKTCAGGYDTTASWLPTPSVGPGGAGAGTGQLVNFSQFGQCAQAVTDPTGLPSATNPLVLAACKQVSQPVAGPPTPALWPQNFAYDPITSRWTTSKLAGSPYCLTRSLANTSVTFAACTSDPLQVWKDHGAAAADQANASQWAFSERYTIVDPTGLLCLSLNQTTGQPYTTITSETCDGSARQKWNAGSAPQSSTTKDTSEK
jgi:hypothetical protein